MEICDSAPSTTRSRLLLQLISEFVCPKRPLVGTATRSVRLSVLPASCPVHNYILFEVGISNLACGCIIGWRSAAYHFGLTVTLTSDLLFIIIVTGAYLLYYLR